MLMKLNNTNVIITGNFDYSEIDWLTQTVDSSARADCKSFLYTAEDCFLTQHVLDYTQNNAILDLVVLTRKHDLVSEVRIGYISSSEVVTIT